ncbi:hypothetical protein BY996DRAFT_6573339 [Phakopsora pachyrhizi]|nr:hypothetical protein BY996DRAFT_6573339 [Phakopsora pachyrhizi]
MSARGRATQVSIVKFKRWMMIEINDVHREREIESLGKSFQRLEAVVVVSEKTGLGVERGKETKGKGGDATVEDRPAKSGATGVYDRVSRSQTEREGSLGATVDDYSETSGQESEGRRSLFIRRCPSHLTSPHLTSYTYFYFHFHLHFYLFVCFIAWTKTSLP